LSQSYQEDDRIIVLIAGSTLLVAVLTLGLGIYEHFRPRSDVHQGTQALILPSSQLLSRFLKWDTLNAFGLLLNTVGALLIASGVIVTRKRVIEEGLGLGVFSDVDKEKNVNLASVQYILKQSKRSACGLIFLVFGFLAQAACAIHSIIAG
jgi:hypothetical protein